MKFSSNNSFSTDKVLLKITCLAWLIAKIMSFKVWTADRNFPVIPALDIFTANNSIHLSLFFVSLLGIAVAFFFPNKKIISAVILIEILSCLLDYMRWQPWEYQYILMFAFFVFAKDRKQFLLLFSFLIGCTYLFSGAHKFGGSFLYTFWDSLVLRRFLHLDISVIKTPIVHYSGLLLCLIEVFIGLGFIFFRNKKLVCILAIVMHLLIILIYGPTGLNYNLIIVPWNFAMLGFALVFFFTKEKIAFRKDFFTRPLNIAVLFLVGFLPVLSFFDNWDQYLSFNLYSGNTKILAICVADTQNYPQLEKYQSTNVNSKYCDNTYIIQTNKWAMDELNVPVIPEERVFKKIKAQFNKTYPDIHNTFVYYVYPYKKENTKEVE